MERPAAARLGLDPHPPLVRLERMAGHAWEGNAQHIVIRTADQALWNLLSSDANGPVGHHEFLVDEELGTVPVV